MLQVWRLHTKWGVFVTDSSTEMLRSAKTPGETDSWA